MFAVKKQLKSVLPLRKSRVWYGLVFTVVALFAFMLPFTEVTAGTIAEEFDSSDNFKPGTLVSIRQDKPDDLELSTIANSDYLLGVVALSGNNLLTFNKNDAKVTVSVSGESPAYVTDANGSIKKGDFIGASWIEGVGMRTETRDERKLIGVALEDFDGSKGKDYPNVSTPDGTKTVKVGSISIRIFDRQSGPAQEKTRSGLELFANKLAGREVSFIRILAGLVVFTISLVFCGVFIHSAIKSSFISIGRNPLASDSIYNSLLQVSGLSIGIILIGTAFAYVILIL